MKRAIIVDDEPAAIGKLEKMLKETGEIDICGTFVDPAAALDFIQKNQADIAFLDIEMPKISGIELADRLMDIQSHINIVFVTAYSEYAVEAFRCHALDYLLKPVEKERLQISVSRLSRIPAISETLPQKVVVNCFGRLSVTIDGQMLKFRTSKAEELFAYLVDNNGQPIHRNHIMDAFWNDYDGDRALILFNTTLHYLKKAFMQYGFKLNVIHHRGSYSLDMAGIECDAVLFESYAAKLKSITADNASECENTLALYTDAYLAQNDYAWAYQKRLDTRNQFIQMTLMLAKYHIENGNSQKAVGILKDGVKFAPLDKGINLMLLKIFKAKNDFVSVTNYFQLYKDRLETELGLDPDKVFVNLLKN